MFSGRIRLDVKGSMMISWQIVDFTAKAQNSRKGTATYRKKCLYCSGTWAIDVKQG